MKKLLDVCAEHPDFAPLVRSVVRGIGGLTYVQDVNEHSIDAGFGSFIYYTDTVRFWRTHKKQILSSLEVDADNIGTTTVEIVQSFRCLCRPDWKPDFTQDEIAKALYGRYNDELDTVYNALAWYAAETVCRWFDD